MVATTKTGRRRLDPLIDPNAPPTGKLLAAVAAHLKAGCPLPVAARAAGSFPESVRRWMREGKEGALKARRGEQLSDRGRLMRHVRRTLRVALAKDTALVVATGLAEHGKTAAIHKSARRLLERIEQAKKEGGAP
jgi:hypothetical protein